jgi:hypothetical protein
MHSISKRRSIWPERQAQQASHIDDVAILDEGSTAFAAKQQRHPMKQVVPWTRSNEDEGITAMNARHIWPHLLTQLHTHLIALAMRA